MNINEAFPSKYLKASDLQGRTITLTMDQVKFEQMQGSGDEKLVLYFRDTKSGKGLVLNKTNSNTIAAIYGPETDAWAGQAITLFEQHVPFQGQTVPAIRVMRPRGDERAERVKEVMTTPAREPGEDAALDAEIPF